MEKMNIEQGISNYEVFCCLLGYEGFCSSNNSNGKTNQPLIKIKNSILLGYSAVPCSIFDILLVSACAFNLLRKGEGTENRLNVMHMSAAPLRERGE